MIKSKLVTVESHGKLPQLGGIHGPIITPNYISINIIISLINAGKTVYEVNPANHHDRIRLTRLNATHQNFQQLPTNPIKNTNISKSIKAVEKPLVKHIDTHEIKAINTVSDQEDISNDTHDRQLDKLKKHNNIMVVDMFMPNKWS